MKGMMNLIKNLIEGREEKMYKTLHQYKINKFGTNKNITNLKE